MTSEKTYRTDYSEELYVTLRKVCGRLGTRVPRTITPMAEYNILLSSPHGVTALEYVKLAGLVKSDRSARRVIQKLNRLNEYLCWYFQ